MNAPHRCLDEEAGRALATELAEVVKRHVDAGALDGDQALQIAFGWGCGIALACLDNDAEAVGRFAAEVCKDIAEAGGLAVGGETIQ